MNILQDSPMAEPEPNKGHLVMVRKNGSIVNLFECIICLRRFSKQYMLARHMPVHTDERCYTCQVCHKAFRQFSTLSQHKVIHSEKRPFKCDVCNKSFNRQSSLSSHSKTHSPTKKFVCFICGKGFHQKGNLRNHVFIHTNERPYKCDICDKGFNQKSNLFYHKASAHTEKTCGLCPAKFVDRRSEVAHQKRTHAIYNDKKQYRTIAPKASRPVHNGLVNNNDSINNLNIQSNRASTNIVQAEGDSFIILEPPLPPKQPNLLQLLPAEDAESCPPLDLYNFVEPVQQVVILPNAATTSSTAKRRPIIPAMLNSAEEQEKYKDLITTSSALSISCSQTPPGLPQNLIELKPSLEPLEPTTSHNIPSEVVVERIPIILPRPKPRLPGPSNPPRPIKKMIVSNRNEPTIGKEDAANNRPFVKEEEEDDEDNDVEPSLESLKTADFIKWLLNDGLLDCSLPPLPK